MLSPDYWLVESLVNADDLMEQMNIRTQLASGHDEFDGIMTTTCVLPFFFDVFVGKINYLKLFTH